MELKYITALYKYRRAFLAFEPADHQCHLIAQILHDCEADSGFRMFFTKPYTFIVLSMPKHHLLESWPHTTSIIWLFSLDLIELPIWVKLQRTKFVLTEYIFVGGFLEAESFVRILCRGQNNFYDSAAWLTFEILFYSVCTRKI